jgi:hypothetical protein
LEVAARCFSGASLSDSKLFDATMMSAVVLFLSIHRSSANHQARNLCATCLIKLSRLLTYRATWSSADLQGRYTLFWNAPPGGRGLPVQPTPAPLVLFFVFVMAVDGRSHPRMNAALNVDRLISRETRRCKSGACRNEEVPGAKRLRHKLAIHYLCALRSRNVISRESIQDGNKTAAELLHPREGMGFSTNILNRYCRGALSNGQVAGWKPPRADWLFRRYFCQKSAESNESPSRASGTAWAKAERVTVIPEFYAYGARGLFLRQGSYTWHGYQ